MFDFSIVTNWIHQMLTSVMSEGWAVFIECVAIGVCIILMYAVLAIVLIYMERKVCGFFQCRLGPMRVGPWGSIQVICDVLKMLTKEIFNPKGADQFLYNLAPFMVIIASFLTFACLPINKGMEVLNFNVGVFFLLAASSVGVVGILLAGWGSNNKFSLIGAMRSGAQIISYELSVGLSILTMVVLMGTMHFSEYLNLFIVSAVAATIFLGGWMPLHISGLDGFNAVMDYIPGFIWFFAKAFFVVFLLMWVKWTFPRLRIDQILALEWKYLVPISLLNLLLMVLIVVFGLHF